MVDLWCEDEPEVDGSADASHGVAPSATPMPSATANAPTRPMYLESPIVRFLSRATPLLDGKLIVVCADRQRSRHTARMIDHSSRRTCGSVLRIPVRLPRAGPAADMFAVVMDVSPRKPPVARIGGLTASSQTSNNSADPTPRPPSRRLLSSLLNRDVCAFNYSTATLFDVSVSKSPGPGAAAIAFEATDYRYSPDGTVPPALAPCDLPDDVGHRLVDVSHGMGLLVSGVDLRRTADDRWCCFEVNPSPGFTYYEGHTGQPIAGAIAALLSGPVARAATPRGASPAHAS